MAELADLTRPIVRAGAGFHSDQASWLRGEERKHLAASQLPAENHGASRIRAMNLEHVLRQIQSNRAKVHFGRLLYCGG